MKVGISNEVSFNMKGEFKMQEMNWVLKVKGLNSKSLLLPICKLWIKVISRSIFKGLISKKKTGWLHVQAVDPVYLIQKHSIKSSLNYYIYIYYCNKMCYT